MLDWGLDKAVTSHDQTTVGLGPSNIYVINQYELAKELFSKEEFSGRSPSKFHLEHRFYNGVPQGIMYTESQWATQRRFSLKTLKDFGFGRQSIEQTINIEVDEIIKQFIANEDDTFLSNDFNIPIINILWQPVAVRGSLRMIQKGWRWLRWSMKCLKLAS